MRSSLSPLMVMVWPALTSLTGLVLLTVARGTVISTDVVIPAADVITMLPETVLAGTLTLIDLPSSAAVNSTPGTDGKSIVATRSRFSPVMVISSPNSGLALETPVALGASTSRLVITVFSAPSEPSLYATSPVLASIGTCT